MNGNEEFLFLFILQQISSVHQIHTTLFLVSGKLDCNKVCCARQVAYLLHTFYKFSVNFLCFQVYGLVVGYHEKTNQNNGNFKI